MLELEIGSQFTLYEKNNNVLMKAWSYLCMFAMSADDPADQQLMDLH